MKFSKLTNSSGELPKVGGVQVLLLAEDGRIGMIARRSASTVAIIVVIVVVVAGMDESRRCRNCCRCRRNLSFSRSSFLNTVLVMMAERAGTGRIST
jgi:hypothetical protein